MFSKDKVVFSSLLNDITLNGKLSEVNKKILRQELINVTSESGILEQQASQYHIIIELNDFLEKLKSFTDYISELVKKKKDLTIDQEFFVETLYSFYTSKEVLVRTIMNRIATILERHEAILAGIHKTKVSSSTEPEVDNKDLKSLNKFVRSAIEETNKVVGGIGKNLNNLTGKLDSEFSKLIFNYEEDIYNLGEELREKLRGVDSKVQNVQLAEPDLRGYYTKDEIAQLFSSLKFDEYLATLFDADGYFTGKIRPLAVETTSVSVGADSTDFTLTTKFKPNYLANANSLYWEAGELTHFKYNNNTTFKWFLSSGNRTNLDPNKSYYIYAKCNQNGSNGTILIDTVQRVVNQDPQNYYFKIGTLSSVILGVRGITLSYGRTEINGREITTGKIQSIDGKTYFDLDTGVIGGRITFLSTDGEEKPISDLENQISNISIGSNLLRNSNFSGEYKSWFQYGNATLTVVSEKLRASLVSGTAGFGAIFYPGPPESLITGEVYTMSATITTTKTLTIAAYIGGSQSVKNINGTERISFTGPLVGNQSFIIYAAGLVVGDYFDIDNVIISKGSAELDWSPNPQDVVDSINAIQVGGRNLLRNSDVLKQNNLYNIANYNITESISVGELCTITLWGSLGAGKSSFYAYNSGGNVPLASLALVSPGVYRATFNWVIGSSSNTVLWVYTFPNTVTVNSTITKIKLERGNKATDWSPAGEDITAAANAFADSVAGTKAAAAQTAAISAASADAEAKANNAYSTAVSASNVYAATVANSASSAAQIAAAADASAKATAAYNSAKAAADIQYQTLTQSLIDVPYRTLYEYSINGRTIINGGFIDTNLVRADVVWANVVNAGYISAGQISATLITTGTLAASRIDVDNLVVKNLRTSTSGQRVVLSAATNNLIFYGPTGNESVRIDGTVGVGLGFYTGLKATHTVDSNRFSSVTGGGISSNSTDLAFVSTAASYPPNVGSIVGYAAYRIGGNGSNEISAGIVGMDLTGPGQGLGDGSLGESYAGYFIGVVKTEVLAEGIIITAGEIKNRKVSVVIATGNVNLPYRPFDGQKITVKNGTASNIQVFASQPILDVSNNSVASTIIMFGRSKTLYFHRSLGTTGAGMWADIVY